MVLNYLLVGYPWDFWPLDDIFELPGRNELVVCMKNGQSVLLSPHTPVGRGTLSRLARKTITPRLSDFFTDSEKKKTDVLQSTNKHTALHSGVSRYWLILYQIERRAFGQLLPSLWSNWVAIQRSSSILFCFYFSFFGSDSKNNFWEDIKSR